MSFLNVFNKNPSSLRRQRASLRLAIEILEDRSMPSATIFMGADNTAPDDQTSVRRVAQANTTGSLALPRVGWEVLVEFNDSDPDRPVIVGAVPNPDMPQPTDASA